MVETTHCRRAMAALLRLVRETGARRRRPKGHRGRACYDRAARWCARFRHGWPSVVGERALLPVVAGELVVLGHGWGRSVPCCREDELRLRAARAVELARQFPHLKFNPKTGLWSARPSAKPRRLK